MLFETPPANAAIQNQYGEHHAQPGMQGTQPVLYQRAQQGRTQNQQCGTDQAPASRPVTRSVATVLQPLRQSPKANQWMPAGRLTEQTIEQQCETGAD